MKQLKDETLSIRTSANIKLLLKRAAVKEHRSVASMVEVLVLAYAKQHGLEEAQSAEDNTGERQEHHGID
ncbi:hypothetical protein [Ideonella livida]|uniref:CopG-like ribbon-helix-helix domain-containing protein n=1 Tax=Ideonella livida TaxID=2707176 RepID=A0A7C9TJJ2_9BURK|nr:hypothetical protein [Ideonella livida]NDY92060.1 hypothetical protein [Ideonella livida]